ncbi:peptidoglycan-binding protein [Nostocaceae cyanobacterium CENA369]|uniref:Peptidoglycan-binding protein n=1 Tax=Dendronalium phyllosphericum CENA369 TaxID=1725256 RepID=A0A8J7I0D7_9NOST|nr:peptidoglycan-binding protein [Dendronalium phyllosphericum]MBH8573660.1 peptidoglycan-binding protein [Dendronalium phyllosphericum CENA369]
MEAIIHLHLASVYEASEHIEIVPIRVNFKFWRWQKLSSAAVMRLLPVALTIGILSLAGQTLALQKEGSNGPEVATTQRCLKKLGYYNGSVTGKFAALTRNSVIRFQQAKKLTTDGIVGSGTQKALQQACQSKTLSRNTTSGLRLGSKGSAVLRLQQNLGRLRYFNGPNTGYFGSETQQAVIRFQRSARIPVDGIANTRTQQAISSRLSVGGDYPVLKEGSSGPSVTLLQQRLKQLGYFSPNPTGNFKRITKDAVIAFQRNAGIPATGIANQQTWDALSRYSSANTSSLSTQQVKDLQQYLRDLGYFKTNPTGTVGPLTRDAIARFQRSNNIYADGNANVQVLEAVRRVWTNKYATQPTRDFLTVGDKGDNVRAVQERLSQYGFFNGSPDGYFDEYTRTSIIAFQQSYGLNVTGTINGQTWQTLGLNTAVASNGTANNRYVVVVPANNNDTLNRVRQYVPFAFPDNSRLGNYVNAGEFGDRTAAERVSNMLRSNGLDARVQYF